jgi:O-antigen ligase
MIRINTALGIGLWALLWAGYNTGPSWMQSSGFPHHSVLELIHGLRAYAPILGGWIAIIVIFTRMNHLRRWFLSPVGLVLIYGIVGVFSSMAVSIQPEEATYWGSVYLSIALVLLAIVLVDDPLPDLRRVLEFTWIVGTMFTLSLLGIMPFMGRDVVAQTEVGSVRVHAYTGAGEIMGMSMTRNTGFARYAAISGLVGLARIWEGSRIARLIWGAILVLSVYALVISNGRTEVISFIVGAFAVMIVRKSKRTVLIVTGVASAVLLGMAGFYREFFLYITRTGQVDVSMSGRTDTWGGGLDLFWRSPIFGMGFQADRFYLHDVHLHNAFLHVLVQAGILGGGAILLALAVVWFFTLKHFYFEQPQDKSLIPPEIPGVLLFITISSIAESTFAYFSAAWLLSAPIFGYVMALENKSRKSRAIAAWARRQVAQDARRRKRILVPSEELSPPTAV